MENIKIVSIYGITLKLYCYLLSIKDEHDLIYNVSQKSIADLLTCNRGSVIRGINRLIEYGLLELHKTDRHTRFQAHNIYRVKYK